MPALGHRADRGDCHRHAARRRRAAGAAVADAASEGFRYRPLLDWRDEGLRRVLVLMGPGTIGLAATQVNVFVNTHAGDEQRSRAPSRG